MVHVQFHDREEEIRKLQNIVNARPDLITFIYGPINSGKTELIQEFIKKLPGEFITFYVNLRGKFIRDYNDFMRALFKFENRSKEEIIKSLLKASAKTLTLKGIPVPENVIDVIFGKEKEDVFEFLEDYFGRIGEHRLVLIIDELQVIGDIEIDGKLVYRLFNFFVRLTKELHLCHVFVITSDSLFVEHVYSEAMLQGRCRYMLVDDFDYTATASFLKKYGFKDDEVEVVWQHLGGKPIYLIEAINVKTSGGNVKEFCEQMVEAKANQIKFMLDSLRLVKKYVEFERRKNSRKLRKSS